MPPLAPSPSSLSAAIQALREGRLVGLPTETVYGLAADATNSAAVAAVYAAKGRPAFNPLIAHVPDVEAARNEGVFDHRADALAKALWPGPLTLVLPVRESASVIPLARAGLDTIALRVPAHEIARAVLAGLGRPVAAPSANRSGHVSPTTAAHVIADLGDRVALVLDGGPSVGGLESTVVGLVDGTARLLRPGAIPRAAIEALIGPLGAATDHENRPMSPGLLARHYATRTPLRLDAVDVRPGEVVLGFGGLPPGAHGLDLSPSGDTVEAAANLYAHLRALDALGAAAIAVAPIPAEGLGEAIRDRLERAARG